jgi:hypothetical protein
MRRLFDNILGPGMQRGWRALLTRDPANYGFAKRGFYLGNAAVQQRLERVSESFLAGYNLGLQTNGGAETARALRDFDKELSGFAFEGAAMSLAILDHVTPWNTRLGEFLEAASQHMYMAHVGIGCAVARLPWLRRNAERVAAGFDPLMRWLVIDGYGFHQAFFYPGRFVGGAAIDARLSPAAQNVFDQGVGRSLWFSQCGDLARLVEAIRVFDPRRHADLWTGIGVACGMAGIVSRATLESMVRAAGSHVPNLALGAVNAVRSRARAGNPAPHTDLTCEKFCGMPPAEALSLADSTLAGMVGSDYRARQFQVTEAFRHANERLIR